MAWIEGPKKGKTIMLRADIDALTVDEQTGYDFASKHDGKMHACGHDAHMAILLGAAKMLKTLQDKSKVRYSSCSSRPKKAVKVLNT